MDIEEDEAVEQELKPTNDIEDNSEKCIRILNDLLNQKSIGADDFKFWRKKFEHLNSTFFQIMERETAYHNKGKKLNRELLAEKKRLRGTEKDRINNQQYLTDLKRDLLKSENQLALSNESESVQQIKIIETERKISSLERDKASLLEQKDQLERPILDKLKNEVRDLKNSIRETTDRIKKEEANRVYNMENIKNLESETKDLREKETELSKELSTFRREPERTKKQCSIVQKALKAAHEDLKLKKEKIESLDQELSKQESKKEEVTKINYNIFIYGDNSRLKFQQIEKEINSMRGQQQSEKQSNSVAMADRVTINLDIQSRTKQLNNEAEFLKSLQKEEETQARACKRMDDQTKELSRELTKQKKLLDTIIKDRNTQRTLLEKIKEEKIELDRDVELQIHNLLSGETECKILDDRLKSKEDKVKELEDKIKKSMTDERDLQKRITAMEMDREKQAREATKQKNALVDAMGEIKVNVFVNDELQKKLLEIETQHAFVTLQYSATKQDRNKYAKHIQDCAQSMAEVREKNKILENEQEVLTRQCHDKDKEVKRIKRAVDEDMAQKTILIGEFSARKIKYEEKEKINREQIMEIEKLNMTINTMEELMLSLKHQYENGVQDRNFTGIQLIDRNDQLCILYEKSNMQENLVTQGELVLNKMDQEQRLLTLDLENVKRELQIVYKKVPEFHALRRQREDLQRQIEEASDTANKLSKELENPQNNNRWRRLEGPKRGERNMLANTHMVSTSSNDMNATSPNNELRSSIKLDQGQEMLTSSHNGKDTFLTMVNDDHHHHHDGDVPNDEELLLKIQELEEKLNTRKEQLMEKNLVIQEVTKSSDKLRKLAISGRDQTFDLAVSMNQIQGRIKDTNKQMMATLAELAIYKANSANYQSMNEQLTKTLDEIKQRMERGEPPSLEILEQIEKQEENERRRKQEMMARKERADAEDLPPTIIRTTAAGRVNSYIPDDRLGIPKPYYFKPMMWTESGANMRHYRNPKKREIVL
ncbi:coiled-coil domain-containing protein [Acrasis kona]|uniref:Coiled-coil domain-containing protein n=1 Tax=Acrasis kona TaxID=1008807 RepID=A0AAW2YSS0_9EUKA